MNRYHSKDICVLTPTKDRPHKIVNLLKSLSKQTCKVGRIIIVGSGQNIEDLVINFSDKLPVEYYHCEPPGQIRQRKLGVLKLDERTKLVATLDDDIILEKNVVENLVKFWNSKDEKTAGVGFNITNIKSHRYSRVREMFYASAKEPAKVLKSGFVTQLTNVSKDIKAEWLNGGATIWKQDILINRIHKREINAKWAPCEDLLLSYPLGRKYELYICSSARVIHDDVLSSDLPFSTLFYRGKTLVYWLIYFVKENEQLSLFASILGLFAQASGELIGYLIKMRINQLGLPLGRFKGLFMVIIYFLSGRDITKLIE